MYDKIEALTHDLLVSHEVLHLGQVATLLAGKVCPKTVKEYYIKGKRLPSDADLPLPANRIGHAYHVEKEALDDWRLGRTTVDDLYEWQREKMGL